MKIAVVEKNNQYEDSITESLVKKAKKEGYRAVFTVTCLTCNTRFMTEHMPPRCPNQECPEHNATATQEAA